MKILKKVYIILLIIPIYIFAKDTITVAIDYEYAPITYKSFEGKPEGLFVEFWKLWGKKSGYDIKFKFYDWDSSVKAVKNGEVVFHSGLTPDKKWMVSSHKFYELKTSFFKLKNKKLPKKLKIGTIDSYYFKLASEKYPKAKIIMYDDYFPLIKDILNSKIDMFIDDEIAINTFLLQKGVKAKFETIDGSFYSDIKVITNQKNKKYIDIFNKYLNQISNKEFSDIEKEILNDDGYYGVKLKHKNLHFTKKEQEWLDKNETITYVYDPDWAPFEWNNGVNKHTGIIADILYIIKKRSGINFKPIHTKTWSDAVELAKNNKVDMYSAVIETDDRKKYMDFTSKNIFKYYGCLVVRNNSDIKIKNVAEDLKGKKIGITKGNALSQFMKQKYPNFDYIEVSSTQDGFKKLKQKLIDVYVVNIVTANYYIKNKGFSYAKVASKMDFIFALKIAISKKKAPEVISIINKTINTIDKDELNALYDKWIKNSDEIIFTEKEKNYLKNQKTIKYVYDNHREPFEYTNELGFHSGIVSDIINLISKKSTLKFKAIQTKNWNESVMYMKENKADMFSFVIENKQREKYLNFTKKVLFKIPLVLVTNINDKKIYEDTKFDLGNKKIGIVKGRAVKNVIVEKFPYFNIVEVSSIEDGLNKVENGEIDMLAINKSTAKYYIRLKGFDKIRIATNLDIYFNFKMAFQKSLPKEVIDIVNKSLEKITDKDINDIYNKYVNIRVEDKTDWALIAKIGFFVLLLVLFILWNNKKLKLMVEDKTMELSALLDDFDENIIASKTDLKGNITYASKAFCDISQYSQNELIGKNHGLIRHPDMPDELYEQLWKTIKKGDKWRGETKNLKKDGGYYWINLSVFPEYDKNGELIGYSSISHDITAQKEVEILTLTLEEKVKERTEALHKEKQFIQTLLDSQEQLIVTTNGKKLIDANKTFFEFFKVKSIEDFSKKYNAKCICDTFNKEAPSEYLQSKVFNQIWIDYIIKYKNIKIHKVMITVDDKNFIFSVTATTLPNENGIKSAVFTNITDIENAKIEIENIHKKTRESIEYASLIQGALIPKEKLFQEYFSEYFTIWQPKDTVGGDIYLFETLRNEDEALLMVIDCTGHGVPGAFVTMLVKAIERQIISNIKHSDDLIVSPARILSVFNQEMKRLLKQDSDDGILNAGFDGGIIYIDKKNGVMKFAGAQTPLFYMEDDNLKMIKGDRYSVGYRRCAMDYKYKEYNIDIKENMKFYITTDGYIDQNGGEKGFSLGKTRFKKIIQQSYSVEMKHQKQIFLDELKKYQENYETNDDITLIGFKI